MLIKNHPDVIAVFSAYTKYTTDIIEEVLKIDKLFKINISCVFQNLRMNPYGHDVICIIHTEQLHIDLIIAFCLKIKTAVCNMYVTY